MEDIISNLLLVMVSASTEVSRCSCDQTTTSISIWCSSVSHQWPQRSCWKRGLLLALFVISRMISTSFIFKSKGIPALNLLGKCQVHHLKEG